jgi:hypothetical protein
MRTIVTRRETQIQSCGRNLRMRLERDDTETRGLRGLGFQGVGVLTPMRVPDQGQRAQAKNSSTLTGAGATGIEIWGWVVVSARGARVERARRGWRRARSSGCAREAGASAKQILSPDPVFFSVVGTKVLSGVRFLEGTWLRYSSARVYFSMVTWVYFCGSKSSKSKFF